MTKNVGWEAKSNHDGSYTVTVNGKQYYCADTHEFLHFLEDIGCRGARYTPLRSTASAARSTTGNATSTKAYPSIA